MELDYIGYEKSGHVARVTINRPEALNALNVQCHLELRRAFEEFRADPGAWVAILTGAGNKAFCAGADLKEAAQMLQTRLDFKSEVTDPPVWGGITRDWDCPKPIIAAVNGFALGGGTELALACDLVVAADTAQFGLPEVRRGIVAGAGGLVRLPRQLPLKRAMAMLLTGKSVTAAEAFEFGLVNEVVPAAELQGAADRWAAEIVACAPLSVQASKRVALSLLQLPLEDALLAQRGLWDEVINSADAREGTQAFAEKREPVWSGR